MTQRNNKTYFENLVCENLVFTGEQTGSITGQRLDPRGFGAQADGTTDDGPAINSVLAYAWTNFNNGRPMKYSSNPQVPPGMEPNLGGTVIDFCGLTYLTNVPIVPPGTYGGGNVTFQNGYILAGPNFPAGRSVFEFVYYPNNFMCNLGVYNMNIDCAHLADSGVLWQSVNNSYVDHCVITRFNLAAVHVLHNQGYGGDGVWISNNKFMQYDLGEGTVDPATGQSGTTTATFADPINQVGLLTATGILLNANDCMISHNLIMNVHVGIQVGALGAAANTNGGGASIIGNHIWNAHLCMDVTNSCAFIATGNYFDQAGIRVYDPSQALITCNQFVPGLNTAAVWAAKYTGTSINKLIVTNNLLTGSNLPSRSQPAEVRALTLSATGPAGQVVGVTFTGWTIKPDLRWGYGIQVFENSGTNGMGYFTQISPNPSGDYTGQMMVTQAFSGTSLADGSWSMVSAGVVIDPGLSISETTIVQNNAIPAISNVTNPIWLDRGVCGFDPRTYPYRSFFQSTSNNVVLWAEQNGFRMVNGSTPLLTAKTNSGLAIGSGATSAFALCVALGAGAAAPAVNSVAIGGNVSNSTSNSILLGKNLLDTIIGGHFHTSGSNPTVAAGAAAGTSPTVSVTGNDIAGTVTVTTGTSPSTGVLATVTFATQMWNGAPKCVTLNAANQATAALTGTSHPYVTSSQTSFVINSGTSALAASTAYSWKYLVVG